MKHIATLIIFSCAIIMAACNDGTGPEVTDAIPIIVNDSLYLAAFESQQDELSIENAEIRQDLLQLNVTFPGGCEKHEFGLIASESIEKSGPGSGFILLTHDANNDSCKVEMVDELHFDLSPYREYLQLGLVRSGGIKLKLKGFAEPLMYDF